MARRRGPVVFRVVERAVVFHPLAGTLILAVSILIWAAAYYPHTPASAAPARRSVRRSSSVSTSLAPGDPQRSSLAAQCDELETPDRRPNISGKASWAALDIASSRP